MFRHVQLFAFEEEEQLKELDAYLENAPGPDDLTVLENTISPEDEESKPVTVTPVTTSPGPRKANATILMLARNKDVHDAVQSAKRLQDRFNHKHGYPWVFLNEEPFSEDFKKYVYLIVASFGCQT